MNFRITCEADSTGKVVRVTGFLGMDGIAELERYCDWLELPFTIDCRELIYANVEVACLLAKQVARGTKIKGASPYLAMLVESEK